MERRLPNAWSSMTATRPSRCPRCGGELDYDQELERAVRGGNDVAIVLVKADVCQRCGEALLHPGMADRILSARRALEKKIAAPVVGSVFDLRSS